MSSAPLRRRRAGPFVATLLGGAWVLAAACTLTHGEFEPPLVDSDSILAPGPPSAAPESEPGPDASVCADGDACCGATPCRTGESCVEGRCLVPDAGDAGVPACIGSDCPGSMPPVPLEPNCNDGVQNGDETGSDCGGNCGRACGSGAGCVGDVDCADGLFCSQPSALCTEVSCSDGVLNGNETGTDCGGGTCGSCAEGEPCNVGSDCASLVCGEDGSCAEPNCNDGQANGGEASIDCGGACPDDCANGAGCEDNDDCQSDVCGPGCAEGLGLCCQPPSCDDGVENGTEIDVDCGGSCGGCPDASDCTQDGDCVNNNCDPSGTCISCGDAVRNGTETGIDCGGADLACRRCNAGEACQENPDCVNMFCLAGMCT